MSTGIGGSPITFSGLGTGIDTASIIDALMRIERLPIQRIEQDKARIEEKRGVVQEINNLLKNLRDKANGLFSIDGLAQKAASSSDEKVVTAQAAAGAATGAYNITVNSLAASHTVASTTSPVLVGGTQLDITVGGVTKSVSVDAADTLESVAEKINSTDDMGASASVINNRLVLISRTSGTGGTITTGGTAAAGFGFTTTQNGSDASATVNGLTVTGDSNTITGAISGVSLELKSVGSGTITVNEDTTAIQDAVQGFVDTFNELISNINRTTSYDAASGSAGTLQGDQTITGLKSQVRGIVGSVVGGLSGTKFDSLAQIGITSARDGTMALDAAVFQAALAEDPDAVRDVFGFDDGSGTTDAVDGIARQVSAFADAFSADIISARLTGFGDSMSRMDDKIENLEALMVVKEQRLRQQFTAMETAVFQFQSQAADLAARLGSVGLA